MTQLESFDPEPTFGEPNLITVNLRLLHEQAIVMFDPFQRECRHPLWSVDMALRGLER